MADLEARIQAWLLADSRRSNGLAAGVGRVMTTAQLADLVRAMTPDEERSAIVSWLQRGAILHDLVPGRSDFAKVLRAAATGIDRGEHCSLQAREGGSDG